MNILIPAKSTSTRIPRKNLQLITDNKSLLQWSIENYKRWFPDASISVATEDEETAEQAKILNCNIYPLKPEDLNDTRNARELFYEYLGTVLDRPSILVQCTSPFTLKRDVLEALKSSEQASYAGHKGVLHETLYGRELSQNIKEKAIIAGAFYIIKNEIPTDDWWLDDKYLSQVHMITMLDINTQEDLNRAKWLAQSLKQISLDE